MTLLGFLLAFAALAALASACLAWWLAARARRAEAARAHGERLLRAVAESATGVAGADDDPVEPLVAALESAGLADVAVVVFDEPSGRWLRWAASQTRERLPAPRPVVRVSQRAWDAGGVVADVTDADASAPATWIGCPVPLDEGLSAVLAARVDTPASTAEVAALEACAGALGASRLLFEASLADRDRADAQPSGPLDSLTGLGTAAGLADAIEERCRSGRAAVGVLLVAVDEVDAVAERFGRLSRDEVLRIAARRLRRCLRPDDVLARTDPTIFGILLASETDADGGKIVAGRVLDALASPVAVTAAEVRVSGRVGLAWDASGDCDAVVLLSEAREALARSDGDIATSIRLGDVPASDPRPTS